MFIIWFKFFICAAVILFAGSRLSKYGDVISEKSGISKIWIGAVLLATITSLPELANNISAVSSANAPNLAAGDIFGSCLFNIMIIAILDLIYKVKGRGPILGSVEIGHILTAVIGILLIAVAAAGIVIEHSHFPISFLNIGIYSFGILLVYIIGSRVIFGFEKKRQEEYLEKKVHTIEKHEYKDISIFTAYSRFAIFALMVVLVGSWLPIIGRQLAMMSGWGQTFVGTVFLAFATSIPEIVVSISALSIGAIDMAVGNLLGSNVFNILIIFITDVFYRRGSLLAVVSIDHMITAIMAIIMTGIAIVGLVYRTEKRTYRHISWDAYALFVVYALTIFLMYKLGVGI